MVLGGVDESMYKGPINWFNYNSFRHYSISIKTLKIGENSIGSNLKAIIDTKFEFIHIDNILLSQLKSSLISLLCPSSTTLPQICSLSAHILDGHPLLISQLPSNFTFPPLTLSTSIFHTIFLPNYIVPCNLLPTFTHKSIPKSQLKSYLCSMIRGADSGDKLYLGSAVLKDYYVVIDTQRARVGLAEKTQ